MHTKICKNCTQSFELTDEHLNFYKKLEVPEPTLCPDCREQRRLAWCNERKLYRRKCDLTHQLTLSSHTENAPFPVYYVKEWWNDKWDALSFGQDYDFTRSFFDQWMDLNKKVPRQSLNVNSGTLENSEYVNYVGNLKNCYLIFDTDYSRDCYYGYTVNRCTNVVDCLKTDGSEICYECIDCNNCYNLKFGISCRNCNDSWFLKNCIGCNNCFGCANLERKQFCMYNKQLTQEEYKKNIAGINTGSFSVMSGLKQYVQSAYLNFPNKFMHGFQNENYTGDHLFHCKDTHDSYDCISCHECKHCYSISLGLKTSHDIYQFGENTEMCYEDAVVGYGGFNLKFCHTCNMGNNNLSYCQDCIASRDCFGCIGLKHKQYCILNKQYTETKYKELLPRIIEHMTRTGEWGEYFPIAISNFYYNQTTAQDYYPLTREQAIAKGYKWLDDDKKEFGSGTCQAPDDIKQTPDSITNETLACTACGKNYKIIPQELKFYKQLTLPIPQKCFDCRHSDRMKLRNPQHLWDRTCGKCGTAIKTSYSPSRPDMVYCEKCYLETLI